MAQPYEDLLPYEDFSLRLNNGDLPRLREILRVSGGAGQRLGGGGGGGSTGPCQRLLALHTQRSVNPAALPTAPHTCPLPPALASQSVTPEQYKRLVEGNLRHAPAFSWNTTMGGRWGAGQGLAEGVGAAEHSCGRASSQAPVNAPPTHPPTRVTTEPSTLRSLRCGEST